MTEVENGNAGALVAVGEARSALSLGATGLGMQTHTHSIGVIVPPPDIRAIADKTAAFVARNGKLLLLIARCFSYNLFIDLILIASDGHVHAIERLIKSR